MTTVETTDTPPAIAPADNRIGAAIIHLLTIPFGMIAALISLLVVRRRNPWLRQQARQAVNFQLNTLALKVVTVIATVAMKPILEAPDAFILPQPPSIVLRLLEFGIMAWAAWRAYQGQWNPYPKLIPFLKPLPEPVRGS